MIAKGGIPHVVILKELTEAVEKKAADLVRASLTAPNARAPMPPTVKIQPP